jgi:hypothetical protein
MSANIMKRVSYPPYSLDLAPCNFYIFGHVKESLAGREFADRKEFLAVITHILEGIKKVILKWIFLAWIDCLARCNAINEEYIE